MTIDLYYGYKIIEFFDLNWNRTDKRIIVQKCRYF